MPGPPTSAATGARPAVRGGLGRKVLRYAAGSVVATVCSEVTFLLLYSVVHSTTLVASVIGWLAGALPNYWLNRTWTWRRSGRPSLTREIAPYVAIILGTLVLAAVATSVVDSVLSRDGASSMVRTILVGGTFLGVYAVVFVVRFFLLDRLFRPSVDGVPPGSVGPMSAKDPR